VLKLVVADYGTGVTFNGAKLLVQSRRSCSQTAPLFRHKA